MRRKWWIAAAGLSVLAIGLAFALPMLLPPTPGVTYANYGRIEKGMTREQVVLLLGEPNNNEARRMDEVLLFERRAPDGAATLMRWATDDGDHIEVSLAPDGLVFDSAWNGFVDERTGWEKLRDRLPWFARKPQPIILELSGSRL